MVFAGVMIFGSKRMRMKRLLQIKRECKYVKLDSRKTKEKDGALPTSAQFSVLRIRSSHVNR